MEAKLPRAVAASSPTLTKMVTSHGTVLQIALSSTQHDPQLYRKIAIQRPTVHKIQAAQDAYTHVHMG